MLRSVLATALMLVVPCTASAAMLTFEDLDDGNSDVLPITGTEFTDAFGVTFSSDDALRLIRTGPPTNGFVPNDLPEDTEALGNLFLGTDFEGYTNLVIDYAAPVSELSFDMVDVDGPELFSIIFSDSTGMEIEGGRFTVNGVLQSERSIRGDNPQAGDAVLSRIAFETLSGLPEVQRIEITGATYTGAPRHIGIAFDNFETSRNVPRPSEVPLPGGMGLLLSAMAGLVVINARRTGQRRA